MACFLTIGETYFMREKRCFEILEQQIIPGIIKKRLGGERRLRLWSAGCASGEEAYSLAILLHKMSATLRGWELSILATDINPQSLAKAKEGIYGEWSFRNTPASFRESYFRKSAGGRYALLPRIKEMVTFAPFNLVEDTYPSLVTDTNAMDVIFCRNVLMYFTPEVAGKAVERFQRCLVDGGWLLVSPCETSTSVFNGFTPVNFPDATLYQKGSSSTAGKPVAAERIPGAAPPVPAFLARPPASRPLAPAPHPAAPLPRPDETTTYQEGLTLYEQGSYPAAAEKVAALLRHGKDDPRALALLCRIYANQGRLSEALDLSTRALAADKLSAELHYLRAVILQEQGRDDDSAATLKKALYLDQDLVLAHFSLANLEQRKGKIRESRRYYNTAFSLLDKYAADEIIPGSDGMLAGRLKEIIRTTTAHL
jgi:chemotaxis protein methyltransferase CheR